MICTPTADHKYEIVTPLDVVRVRLQSQGSSTSTKHTSKDSTHTASFKRLPPSLGVTACCREVFWVGDNAQFCLASGKGTTPAADCAVHEFQQGKFTSTLDGLRKIARNEGTLSLWRGLSPTLAMAIPANVIYFTGYDWLRLNPASPINRVANDAYAPLVSGSVARVAAAIAVSPIEMFRTRLQAARGSETSIFRSTLNDLHRMTQSQGYSSLWRGLTLTMWRDVPFSGLYWWGYEAMRNALADVREGAQGKSLDPNRAMTRKRSESQDNHTNTFVDSFIAGASSGAVAAFVTTPFDVGKTRQQVFSPTGDVATSLIPQSGLSGSGKLPEELSMPKFLSHILKEEGMAGLFRGWAARCLKVAPACAIMISSYEVGKRWAKSMNEKMKDTRYP
jgi:solute carrier family 25, member 39/40